MTIAPFNVEVDSQDGRIGIFRITGEVDQATARQLREPIQKAIDSGTRAMMVDMTDCGFIDSTGLAVIVDAWKQLQERDGGQAAFAICCPEPEVRRLLEVTGLDQAIAVRDTPEEAIAVLES